MKKIFQAGKTKQLLSKETWQTFEIGGRYEG